MIRELAEYERLADALAGTSAAIWDWRAILAHLAGIAVDRGYGRLEWAVLDWNEPALRFYDTLDAKLMNEWRILRMEGTSLTRLAQMPPSG